MYTSWDEWVQTVMSAASLVLGLRLLWMSYRVFLTGRQSKRNGMVSIVARSNVVLGTGTVIALLAITGTGVCALLIAEPSGESGRMELIQRLFAIVASGALLFVMAAATRARHELLEASERVRKTDKPGTEDVQRDKRD